MTYVRPPETLDQPSGVAPAASARPPALVTLGEALVDLVPLTPGASVRDAGSFEKAAGGAPANVAAGVARLGGSSRLLSKLGDDELGAYLLDELARAGVDTRWIERDPEAQTVLALVSLDPTSRYGFEFYGAPAAHWRLKPDEVTPAAFDGAGALHLGSISLICEPSRSASLRAIELAEERGLLISFDPNLRMSLWPSLDTAREVILPVAARANLLKLGREELRALVPGEDPEALAGPVTRLVAVTEGAAGVELWAPGAEHDFRQRVPAHPVEAVDATGAGDAFTAALLHACLLDPQLLGDVTGEGRERLCRAVDRSSAFAALTTTRRGGVVAMPSAAELERFLTQRSRA